MGSTFYIYTINLKTDRTGRKIFAMCKLANDIKVSMKQISVEKVNVY